MVEMEEKEGGKLIVAYIFERQKFHHDFSTFPVYMWKIKAKKKTWNFKRHFFFIFKENDFSFPRSSGSSFVGTS